MAETYAGGALSEFAMAVALVKLEPGQILVIAPADGLRMSREYAKRVRDTFAAAFEAAGVALPARRILIAGEPVEFTVVDAANAEA